MARLSASAGRGSRFLSVASCFAFVASTLTSIPVALAQTADAKAELASGASAARAKDWTRARDAYGAANKAQPSSEALDGLANADYQLKHEAEAYAFYTEWLKLYGAGATRPKKAAVEARLKELDGKTGALTLDVNEAGAAISVDERPFGTSPLSGAIHLSPGPHRIRVTKDGFLPFDQAPNIVLKTPSTLKATLEVASTKGRVSVKEKGGKPIRVIVDGNDVGDAPWSGELDAGMHEVTGRSATLVTLLEKVSVERGKTKDVDLVATETRASLKVTTSDGKGLIYIDDKLVGEGTFASDLPAGAHKLRITREGYDPFEEAIDLKDKDSVSRSVTLSLSSKIETTEIQKERRALDGIYGGFGLFGTLLPGGAHSSMQSGCEGANKPEELASCEGTTGGLGAGLNGYLGYHWDPVGVELFLGGQYDVTNPTLHWVASDTSPGIGPDPSRTEDFVVRRAGGFLALRLRLTFQSEKIRFSVAGGAGGSYRVLVMTRETHATDPNLPGDGFSPSSTSYVAPMLSLEPSIQYRLSGSTSIALGITLLAESPNAIVDNVPETPADKTRTLGPAGLTTPRYQLAKDAQIFVGPFIGMMFGP